MASRLRAEVTISGSLLQLRPPLWLRCHQASCPRRAQTTLTYNGVTRAPTSWDCFLGERPQAGPGRPCLSQDLRVAGIRGASVPRPRQPWGPYPRGTACVPAGCCRTGTGFHRRRTCRALQGETEQPFQGQHEPRCLSAGPQAALELGTQTHMGAVHSGLWACLPPCH